MTQNTENVPTEGAPDANQGVSADKGAPTSPLDVEALKQALGPWIADEVKRSAQSVKDRRISKLETQAKDFKSQLAEFTALQQEGLSQKQAIQYMEMQELLARQSATADEPDDSPEGKAVAGRKPSGAGAKAIELILSDLDLSPTSPEVIAVLRDTEDLASQLEQFSALAKKKSEAQKRPANVAQLMGVGGGSTPPDELAATTTRLEQAFRAPSKLKPKELDEELKKLEDLVKKNQ